MRKRTKSFVGRWPAPGLAQACRILMVGLLAHAALAEDGRVAVVSPVEPTSYVLQELDVVAVQVFGEPELAKVQRIDGEGNIRLDLIGTVQLAGLTLREAEEMIGNTYTAQRYLRAPEVSIQVEEYARKYISVLGEVAKPGRVQLEQESNGMRLVDALSAVGGFNGIAKGDAVRITRESDGTERTVTVDLAALINGKPAGIPPEFLTLLPGDVVYVPERLF